MPNYHIAMLLEVEITDSNKYVDINIGAGEVTKSITTGIYNDMIAVMAALETQLKTSDATFSVDVDGDGTVTISRTGSFSLLWKTGTHGSDNADTHIGSLLGYADSADDSGSASYDSDYQHQYGWYSNEPPSSDSYNMPEVTGGTQFVSVSGRTERMTNPNDFVLRDISFTMVPIEKVLPEFATGSYTNQDFVTWWRLAARNTPFELYSSTDPTFVSEGTFVLTNPLDKLISNINRVAPEVGYYNFNISMREDPTT